MARKQSPFSRWGGTLITLALGGVGVWWFVSQSPYVALKGGDYLCSQEVSSQNGVPMIRDPRANSLARVRNNEVVGYNYVDITPDGVRYKKRTPAEFSLEKRHGRKEFRARVDGVLVICKHWQ